MLRLVTVLVALLLATGCGGHTKRHFTIAASRDCLARIGTLEAQTKWYLNGVRQPRVPALRVVFSRPGHEVQLMFASSASAAARRRRKVFDGPAEIKGNVVVWSISYPVPNSPIASRAELRAAEMCLG
jgi:hypothetical protein